MQPWHLLIDETVDGVVIGTRDSVIANHVRRGLLDVRLYWVYETYDPLSEEFTGYRDQKFFILPQTKRTPYFDEKRLLARLRLPAFELWRRTVIDQIRKFATSYDDIDAIIAEEIGRSTYTAPSENLAAYARMSALPIENVYEYFKLYVSERTSIRLMIRALAEKHSLAINACMNQADIAVVCEAMKRDFQGRKQL
jgi:hypothetical protein